MPDPSAFSWLVPALAVAVFALATAVAVCLWLYFAHARLGLALREAEAGRDAAAAEQAELKGRLAAREEALAEAEKRLALLERNHLAASQAKAALEAELAASDRARREQAELFQKSEARLREAFASLSGEALGRNNELFLTLAREQFGKFQETAKAELEARKTAVDALVKPIGEELTRVKQVMDTAEKALKEDYGKVMEANRALMAETGRLNRALGGSSARGRWGELQLRRVVEMAGMLAHCDFEEQVTVRDGDGRALRPDLTINLPGGRTVVVDAKAPMDNYLRGQEAPDEAARKEFVARHARDVRAHMSVLGSKAYWSSLPGSLEFVVMFFPNDAVFADALSSDPTLLDFGVDNKVIPASPVTLIALLRAVAYGWQQKRLEENARRIFEMGRELHARFATEYRHLSAVGAALAKAAASYNQAIGSAERMLFPSLRKFSELVESDIPSEPATVDVAIREPDPRTGAEAISPPS